MLDEFTFPLACQAVPRLCDRFGIEHDFTEEIFPAGLKEHQVNAVDRERETVLGELVSRHGVSLWDVFDESGIGEERNAIARDFATSGSHVLDVATGRGYFAFAAAHLGSKVAAVDIMGGVQRAGWWKVFMENCARLGFASVVNGIRSDGSSLPFSSGKIGVAGCIHAIRNFLVPNHLRGTIAEMRRATVVGGRAVLAESSMEAESPAGEVYVAYMRLRSKIGWEVIPPDSNELERLMEEGGFSGVSIVKRRFDRDYAPVEFPSYFISDQPPSIREEHGRIERLRLRNGIGHPPVNIVSGKNEV